LTLPPQSDKIYLLQQSHGGVKMNLLVSMGVVDNAETHAPNIYPKEYLTGDVQLILLLIALAVLIIAFVAFSWYCRRLKKKIKTLQAELDKAKKQQEISDYKASKPERTKKD